MKVSDWRKKRTRLRWKIQTKTWGALTYTERKLTTRKRKSQGENDNGQL